MRTASAPLIALINGSNEYLIADLISIILVTGSVLYYTSADVNIVYGGNTYVPFPFERGSTKTVVGTQVDTLDVTLFAGISNLISGIPIPQFASNGGFDGADVTLYRAFLTSWTAAPTGALIMFTGSISDATPSRTTVQLTVKSDLELLNIQMPRNLYQAGCLHSLYDTGCTLNKASFASNTTINATSTKLSLNCALATAAGYFDQGYLVFTSGQNAGVSRTIKKHTLGNFIIALSLPFTPTVGDAFTVYAGCDKTQATCTSKFNNVIHFRGYPFIPIPETAV
jgi:uncharacterized phage protein (TIGR02218 family)